MDLLGSLCTPRGHLATIGGLHLRRRREGEGRGSTSKRGRREGRQERKDGNGEKSGRKGRGREFPQSQGE